MPQSRPIDWSEAAAAQLNSCIFPVQCAMPAKYGENISGDLLRLSKYNVQGFAPCCE